MNVDASLIPEARSGDADKQSLGAKLINGVFDRHKVPTRQRAGRLQELLKISYPAAYRRLSGDTSWPIEDIAKVAAAHGESLADLFAAAERADAVTATFVVGAFRARCTAWLGEPADHRNPTPLVARAVGDEWIVTPHLDDGKHWMVKRIEIRPSSRLRIAVLDDDRAVVDSACAYLRDAGFDPYPFYTRNDLQEALRHMPFDGYIVDWLVGDETARQLLGEIRQRDPNCPIAVLTGQVQSGRADASEVADAIQTLNLSYFVKPMTLPIIAAALTKAFERQRPSA